MRIVLRTAQVAACAAVLVGVSLHRVQAEPAPDPAPAKEQPRLRVLDRTLLSIALPKLAAGDKPGTAGTPVTVNHTADRGWVAKVAHGNPRSPGASNGVVVVGSGGSSEVWGYDLESGKRRWSARSDDSGISSIVISGDSAYFTTYSCTLERVLVATGVHKFRKWISPTVDCAPDVGGDMAFASYRAGTTYQISAHSTSSGAESWKVPAPGNVIYAPVVRGQKLYVATTDGRIAGFDTSRGTMEWNREAGATGAPVATDFGLLVVTATTDNGILPAKAPAPAKAAPQQPAAPAADSGKNDRKTDRKTESRPAPPVPEQAAQTADVGLTLAAVGDRRLALITNAPEQGAGIRLSGPTGSGLDYQGPRPGVDGNLCVIALGNRVIALDLASGATKLELQVETRHGEFCQPAFGDGMVFLADSYGFVTALDRNTGNLVWSYKAEGYAFGATPAISNNRVVLTTTSGLLLCLPTGTKQARKDHKPAEAFQKAVINHGGVKPANDVPDPRRRPTAQSGEPGATPIEPAPTDAPRPGTQSPPAQPPATERDPFEDLPEDRRVGPGGIPPPKSGPGGIVPREPPGPALPNPFEKKR